MKTIETKQSKRIKAMYNCTGGGYSPYSDGILQ